MIFSCRKEIACFQPQKVREAEMFVALRKLVGEHENEQRWHGAVEVGLIRGDCVDVCSV